MCKRSPWIYLYKLTLSYRHKNCCIVCNVHFFRLKVKFPLVVCLYIKPISLSHVSWWFYFFSSSFCLLNNFFYPHTVYRKSYITVRLLRPRPPNKILCKSTNGNLNRFPTNYGSKQAAYAIEAIHLWPLLLFCTQTLLDNLQRICWGGLGWSSRTVNPRGAYLIFKGLKNGGLIREGGLIERGG